MSRLMLTVAPIISVLAGIGFSVTIERLLLRIPAPEPENKEKEEELSEEGDDAANEDEKVEKEAGKEDKVPTDWLFFVRNHPLPLKLM